MQAPAQFYIDNNIPKVRWMYPGKAYKARLITVSRELDAAKMFVYVLDSKYVIAFRDEQLQHEIGMMRIEHFELFGHLDILRPPHYTSKMPIALTYGQLLDSDYATEQPIEVQEPEPEPVIEVAPPPPEPPQQFEQLTLF